MECSGERRWDVGVRGWGCRRWGLRGIMGFVSFFRELGEWAEGKGRGDAKGWGWRGLGRWMQKGARGWRMWRRRGWKSWWGWSGGRWVDWWRWRCGRGLGGGDVSDGPRWNHWHVAMEDKKHGYHSITDGKFTKFRATIDISIVVIDAFSTICQR